MMTEEVRQRGPEKNAEHTEDTPRTLRLREVRRQQGLKPQQVRHALWTLFAQAVSPGAFWRWEADRCKPDVTTLWRLAHIYNLPVDALYRQSACVARSRVGH